MDDSDRGPTRIAAGDEGGADRASDRSGAPGGADLAASDHGGATDGAARAVLREHGLRYSRPREMILRFLLERDRHVSAEGLFQALRERGEDVSLSTVYLNLGVLAGANLVREFMGSAGETLYDSNVQHHYHLICRETGEVRDVEPPLVDGVPLGAYLKAYVELLTGWEVDEPRVTLRGRRRTG